MKIENNPLLKIANCMTICRIYYGDDEENKPNDFCFWDEGPYVVLEGWYENDESLRKRTIEATKGIKNV